MKKNKPCRFRTVGRLCTFASVSLAMQAAFQVHAAPKSAPHKTLPQIDHFIVIYQENWSFDALYGNFPGANGLQNAAAAGTIPQVDAAGNPILYTPSPLNNGV